MQEIKSNWTYIFSNNLNDVVQKNVRSNFSINRAVLWRYCNYEIIPSVYNVRKISEDLGWSIDKLIPMPDGTLPYRNPINITQGRYDAIVRDFIKDFTFVFENRMGHMVSSYMDNTQDMIVEMDNGVWLRYYPRLHNWGIIGNNEVSEISWRKTMARRICSRLQCLKMHRYNLSELTGISVSTISSYTTGRSSPSVYYISLISNALQCAPSYLVPLKTGLFEALPVVPD